MMGWDPCYECGGLPPDGKGHTSDCIYTLTANLLAALKEYGWHKPTHACFSVMYPGPCTCGWQETKRRLEVDS